MVYPVSVYVYITLLLIFKSFGWWNTLFLIRLVVEFIFFYPYKILRYWYVMHKFQQEYLSILYIMYSIIHIRYCDIPPNIYLLYPYKILCYCFIPLSPFPSSSFPPYIYVQYFTQSYVNIQLISRISSLISHHHLSILCYLSILSLPLSHL